MTTQRRYTAASSCEGKKRYTRLHAERAARHYRRQGENVLSYPCRHCGWHHVGHNNRVK